MKLQVHFSRENSNVQISLNLSPVVLISAGKGLNLVNFEMYTTLKKFICIVVNYLSLCSLYIRSCI